MGVDGKGGWYQVCHEDQVCYNERKLRVNTSFPVTQDSMNTTQAPLPPTHVRDKTGSGGCTHFHSTSHLSGIWKHSPA